MDVSRTGHTEADWPSAGRDADGEAGAVARASPRIGDADAVGSAERRRAIYAEIESLGTVVPGSIVERSTRCQRAGCHCRADPPRLHGPYPTWLHLVDGRQVTKTLAPDQAEQILPLIAADRGLRALVHELEALGAAEWASGLDQSH